MKIAVTGALGHIGSRLIRSLPDLFPGVEILIIDNLSTQRYGSIFDLPSTGKYRMVEADIMDAELPALFDGVDVVVHLAALTNAAESFKIKDEVFRINLEGVKRVADACVQRKCALIFPSTTSVYGTQSEIVDENCSEADLKPQSPYAEAKLEAEKFLVQLGKEKDLPFIICRLGTIFGISPGMRFHTAINKFCWQAVLGQPITVWRTALHQNRPYLDLGDAVRAIAFVMQMRIYDRRLYNVVTTNTSVNEIIRIISGVVPRVTINEVDSKIMNQLSYHVASERFKKLGFQFQGNLEKGIRDTIELIRAVGNKS